MPLKFYSHRIDVKPISGFFGVPSSVMFQPVSDFQYFRKILILEIRSLTIFVSIPCLLFFKISLYADMVLSGFIIYSLTKAFSNL